MVFYHLFWIPYFLKKINKYFALGDSLLLFSPAGSNGVAGIANAAAFNVLLMLQFFFSTLIEPLGAVTLG